MEKTAKIISVQENQKQYSGKGGPVFIHLIRFENDIENKIWEYHSSKEICEKFKEGEVATFDYEIKQNGNYTNYLIKPKAAGGAGAKFKDTKDEGVITYLSCFSSACNFYAKKLQVSEDDVLDFAEKAFQKAVAKSTKNK